MSIILLGEAVHGVKQFWDYKLEFIKKNYSQGRAFAVGFEADELGIESLKHTNDIHEIILAFPKIMRTKQVYSIIEFCLTNKISIFGFDNRIRVSREKINKDLLYRAEIYTKIHNIHFGHKSYFAIRDSLMAKSIADFYSHAQKDLICLTHNLHIKKNGSEEKNEEIRLKSMREHLSDMELSVRSVSIVAREANFLETNLIKNRFIITDPSAVEMCIDGQDRLVIQPKDIEANRCCYMFGCVKESQSAADSYDEVIVFDKVQEPNLLSLS